MDLPSDYFLNNSVLLVQDSSMCDLSETLATRKYTTDLAALLFGVVFYIFVTVQIFTCCQKHEPDAKKIREMVNLLVHSRAYTDQLLTRVSTLVDLNNTLTFERDDLNNRLNGILATIEGSRQAAANLLDLLPPEHDTQG